jgi:TonB-linked SusC/RagA family outer membrane protein
MKRLLLLTGALCVLLCATAFAQDRNISGKVTAQEDGSPLPGVNVLVKGSGTGTITDTEGNYKLSVPANGSTLVFSFVGFLTQELPIGNLSVIDVKLATDFKQLTEVVVTAVGIEQNKRDLGYAIQQVNASELIQSREANIVNALNSKVAGVQVVSSAGTPGASAQIRVRGGSSILGNNEPLFVVDGIPIDNSSTGNAVDGVNQSNRAVDINPNDIESMTVLKGPAATVQYGIRGSNGVVIITTKKGKGKQKATVTYSNTTTIDQVNRLPEMQLEWAQGRNGVYRGPATGEATSWGPRISDLRFDGNTNDPYDRNGGLVLASAPGAGAPARAYDNVGTFYQPGFNTENFLSLSGGNEKNTFYASVGHLNQKGIIPLNDFKRTTFKLSGETAITDKLRISGSAAYTNSGGRRIQQGSNLSGLMLGLLRTPPTFDNTNGISSEPWNDPASYSYPDGTHRSYRFNYDNPYWTINKSPFRDDVNRLIGNLSASYAATDWLKITYRAGVDTYTDRRQEGFDIGSKTNLFGALNDDQIFLRNINSDLFAIISKNLTKDLELSATIGHNYFNTFNNRVRQAGTTMTIPGFFNISNLGTVVNSNTIGRRKVHGVYGEARLTYKNMLFLNFSARNDWSSTLPVDANSIFYPSVSAAFDLTEAFFKDNKNLNYWKIRASYGTVGNDAPIFATSNYFNRYSTVDGWTDGLVAPIRDQNAFVSNGVLGNPLLKPELTRTIELGTEVSMFNERVSIDYTYYRTQNINQILQVSIAATSGFYQTFANTGRMERFGHELQLNTNPIRLDNGFKWDIGLNFTQYRATVKELFGDVEQLGVAGFINNAVVGEAFPSFYGTRFLRNDAGQVVVDEDGYPIQDDRQGSLGTPIPDWQAGLRNTFSFKGITLTALLDIRRGGKLWNGTKGVLRGFGTSAATADRTTTTVVDGVFENGQPNNKGIVLGGQTYNRNYGFTGLDELNIEDGSWVRLRELNISYGLPAKWLEKTKFVKAVNLSLTGRNLLLFTKYTGVDPETNLTGSSNAFGEDYFNMPNIRSYGFNVSVTF